MSRDLTPITISSLSDSVVYPFFAVELLFDGNGAVRMWTGLHTITVGGNDYVGLGNLLNISDIEETSEMAVKGAALTLSGVNSELLSLALTEPYQGRVCNIYFGVVNEGVFNQVFSGYMDQMNISETGDTSTIELTVENKLIDLERPRVARFTSGYQKSVYPNDSGLDFVEGLQDKKTMWGRTGDN